MLAYRHNDITVLPVEFYCITNLQVEFVSTITELLVEFVSTITVLPVEFITGLDTNI